MNTKTKSVVAILAVALMLGCGLIPFTAVDSNGLEIIPEQTEERQYASLTDIIDAMMDIGYEESFELGDMMFVKVDNKANEEVTIPKNIGKDGGNFVIGEGQYGILSNDPDNDGVTEYTVYDQHYIEVETGGELVVFPLDSNNTGFVANANGNSSIFVCTHNGAIISFLGMSFKIVYLENRTLGSTLNPLLLNAKNGDANPRCEFPYTYDDEKKEFTLGMNVGEGARAGIFNINIDHNDDGNKSLDISGTIAYDEENNAVTMTDTTVTVEINNDNHTLSEKIIVNKFTMEFYGSIDGDHMTSKTTMSIDADIDNLTFGVKNKTTEGYKTEVVIEKDDKNLSKMRIDDLVLTKEYDKSGNVYLLLENISFAKAEFGFVKTTVTLTVKESDFVICANGLGLSVSNFNYGITQSKNKIDDKWTVIANTASADLAMDADSIELTGIAIKTITIDLIKLEDFNLATENLRLLFTASDDWRVVADKINMNGMIAGLNITKKILFNGYTMKLGVSIDNFYAGTGLKSKTIYGGDLSASISTMHNGLERALTLELNGIDGRIDSNGKNTTYIDRSHLKNELPVKTIFASLHEFIDDLNIEWDAKDVVRTDKNTKIDSLTFQYLNFGLIDELHATFNSKVTLTASDKAERFTVTCDSVTGYTIDDGKENTFSISGKGAQFKVYKYESKKSEYFVWEVDLMKGNAEFEGGRLPVCLHVSDKVTSFKANDLRVLRFLAESADNVSGTIVIDTEDSAVFSFRFERNAKLYGITYQVSVSRDYTRSGCYVTFNLGKDVEYQGFIKASKNRILPDSIDDGYEIHFYQKENDMIKFVKTSDDPAHKIIKCTCDGDLFEFCYDGGESELISYGTPITIGEVPEGYIGWTDGTGKIFLKGDVYRMPARDVTLTAVYAKETSPVEKDDKIIIDATGSDIASISGMETVEDGKTVDIIVDGATIEMNSETYNGIVIEMKSKGEEKLFVKVSEMKNSDLERVQKAIKNKVAYSIVMKDGSGNDISYNGNTVFEVTVKVKVSGDISGFKASYVDDRGHSESVGVKGYRNLGNGEYEVTLCANHFSTYALEPIKIDQGNTIVVAIVAVVAVALSAMGIALAGTLARGKP